MNEIQRYGFDSFSSQDGGSLAQSSTGEFVLYSDHIARVAELERHYEEEKAIVDRIWNQLGVFTYGDAAGKSIYDIIAEIQAERDSLKAHLAVMQWTPITESNLPKVGDEMLELKDSGEIYDIGPVTMNWQKVPVSYVAATCYRRPINPPEER